MIVLKIIVFIYLLQNILFIGYAIETHFKNEADKNNKRFLSYQLTMLVIALTSLAVFL